MMIKILIGANIIVWLLLALDAGVVALIIGILGFIANMITLYVNHQQNKRLTTMKSGQEEIVKKQDKLAVDMDGKVEQLIQANKRADVYEGKEAGRAEIQKELAEEPTKPTEVIVVKPAEVIVVAPADVNIIEDKTKPKK